MSKEINDGYKCIFDTFLNYYRNLCKDYIFTHKGDFSGDYFETWYQTTGNPILQNIEEHLNISGLDERVKGFTDLYCHYVDMAQKQGNEDLLLENLFAVPRQMQFEFSTFGFIYAEAVDSESQWQKIELPESGGYLLSSFLALPGNIQFQDDEESGLSNPALAV